MMYKQLGDLQTPPGPPGLQAFPGKAHWEGCPEHLTELGTDHVSEKLCNEKYIKILLFWELWFLFYFIVSEFLIN